MVRIAEFVAALDAELDFIAFGASARTGDAALARVPMSFARGSEMPEETPSQSRATPPRA
jgi:hypothetical protein